MKREHHRILRGSMLLVALVSMSACTKGDADLRQWVEREKHIPGPPLEPVPAIKTFENFDYADQTDRDPFGPSEQEKHETEEVVLDPHPKEPLEEYPLDSLKMVGTLGSGAGIEALVKDPDNKVNRVRIGNYLGQNNGKVTAISATRIDLLELISDESKKGRSQERSTSIELGTK